MKRIFPYTIVLLSTLSLLVQSCANPLDTSSSVTTNTANPEIVSPPVEGMVRVSGAIGGNNSGYSVGVASVLTWKMYKATVDALSNYYVDVPKNLGSVSIIAWKDTNNDGLWDIYGEGDYSYLVRNRNPLYQIAESNVSGCNLVIGTKATLTVNATLPAAALAGPWHYIAALIPEGAEVTADNYSGSFFQEYSLSTDHAGQTIIPFTINGAVGKAYTLTVQYDANGAWYDTSASHVSGDASGVAMVSTPISSFSAGSLNVTLANLPWLVVSGTIQGLSSGTNVFLNYQYSNFSTTFSYSGAAPIDLGSVTGTSKGFTLNIVSINSGRFSVYQDCNSTGLQGDKGAWLGSSGYNEPSFTAIHSDLTGQVINVAAIDTIAVSGTIRTTTNSDGKWMTVSHRSLFGKQEGSGVTNVSLSGGVNANGGWEYSFTLEVAKSDSLLNIISVKVGTKSSFGNYVDTSLPYKTGSSDIATFNVNTNLSKVIVVQ